MADPLELFLWFVTFLACVYGFRLFSVKSGKLLPGPVGLPIVSSLFQIGTKLNESLAELAKVYGPLMTLRLGFKTMAASDRSLVHICADSHHLSASESTESTKRGWPCTLCKPSIEAFQATINITAINPERTILFDDSARNVASAKKIGFTTAIVGKEMLVPGADFAVSRIHNIGEALTVLREHGKEEQIGQESV